MGTVFGKSKSKGNGLEKQKITDKDRAILDLKVTRDKLTKFQKRMDMETENLQRQAKQLLASGRKDRALLALKLRKHKLNEVNSIDAKLLTVLKMIEDIEWESTQVEALKALEAGTKALNKLHEEMSVEDVERLMEETQDAIETEREISQMLAGQFTIQDETELEAELEEMYAREIGATSSETSTADATPALPDAPVAPVLPTVPSHPVHMAEDVKESEDEVRQSVLT